MHNPFSFFINMVSGRFCLIAPEKEKRWMPKREKNPKIKSVLSVIAVVTAVPICAKLMLMSLPYVSATASKAVLLSAGLTMPEGGQAALTQTDSDVSSTVSVYVSDKEEVVSSSGSASSGVTSSASDSVVVNVPSLIPDAGELPADKRGGKILRQAYGGGGSGDLISLVKGQVRNGTSIATATVKQELQKKLELTLTKTTEPQVLIYHTHATESYETGTRDYYDKTFNSRSRDDSVNMNMVGEQIAAYLEAAGIGVIHDKTQHDYPSYTAAYGESMKTIQKHLKEHPTIKVVLDVHRDAIQRQDGTRIAPTAKINGKNAAQIMIIAGAEKQGDITHDFYKNLRFAAYLQTELETAYPGLTRPVAFDYRKFNQSTSPGALLLEIGGHGNSLEEARYTGELAGKAIAQALLKLGAG